MGKARHENEGQRACAQEKKRVLEELPKRILGVTSGRQRRLDKDTSYFVKGYRTHSGSVGKESTCNAGNQGSVPGSRLSPGEGNSNPLQHPHLRNSMDREAWQAGVHVMTEKLNHHHHHSAIVLLRHVIKHF